MTDDKALGRLATRAVESMQLHLRSHQLMETMPVSGLSIDDLVATVRDRLAAVPELDPTVPCPYCGLTLEQMFQAERKGHYICSMGGVVER